MDLMYSNWDLNAFIAKRVLLGPGHPELRGEPLEFFDVRILQPDDLAALGQVLGNRLEVGLLDRRIVVDGMPGHRRLEQDLEVLREDAFHLFMFTSMLIKSQGW